MQLALTKRLRVARSTTAAQEAGNGASLSWLPTEAVCAVLRCCDRMRCVVSYLSRSPSTCRSTGRIIQLCCVAYYSFFFLLFCQTSKAYWVSLSLYLNLVRFSSSFFVSLPFLSSFASFFFVAPPSVSHPSESEWSDDAKQLYPMTCTFLAFAVAPFRIQLFSFHPFPPRATWKK